MNFFFAHKDFSFLTLNFLKCLYLTLGIGREGSKNNLCFHTCQKLTLIMENVKTLLHPHFVKQSASIRLLEFTF